MRQVRTRFAPSPTGIPHIGNTRTALFNWLFARHHGGKFILRIEDTDRERLAPESLPKILEILRWCGLDWDEGPGIGGPYAPYVQSKRLKIYQDLAEKLVRKKWAYYCFCSPERLKEMRKKQLKQGKPPKYDRLCFDLPGKEVKERIKKGDEFVIRLKIPDHGNTNWNDLIQGKISFKNQDLDDQILLKSDSYPTYHLAVVIDDYLMKISHILRAVEWISSTPKHLILYQAFGWQPPEIGHFPLILGPDRAKLSKRHGAKSALDYRDEGYLSEAVVNFKLLLGWNSKDEQEIFARKEMIKKFDLDGIQKQNAIFNIDKLNWFNAVYIRKKTDGELLQLIEKHLVRSTLINQSAKNATLINQTIPLIKTRIAKLSDYWPLCRFFFEEPKLEKGIFRARDFLFLEKSLIALIALKSWAKESIERTLHDLITKKGWSAGDFFMAFRIALTGSRITPPITDSAAILGRQTTLSRLKKALLCYRK